MRSHRLGFVVALASLAACGSDPSSPPAVPAAPVGASSSPPPPPSTTTAPNIPGQSIDKSAMDPSVKPGADFFFYANGGWFAKAEIPADRASAGVWVRLDEQIEKQTTAILNDAVKGNAPPGSTAQKLGDFFTAFMDEQAIEARGVSPIVPELARITKITDARSLAAYLGSELRADVDALNTGNIHTDRVFGVYVDGDLNDPSKNAAYLMQGGLGLPDRSDYLDTSPAAEQRRIKYEEYLATLMRLAKVADAEGKAKKAIALERRIAEAHVTRVEAQDVSKANNPWPRGEFAKRAPGLEWDAFFKAASLEKVPTVMVWMPTAIAGEAALAKSAPIADWRAYLTARAIDRHASLLPKAFADARFAFYGKTLSGVEQQAPRTRRAIHLIDDVIPDELGREYVKRYFPAESKRAVDEMVTNVVAAFARRIDALAWMSDQTKAKAKQKLTTLKIGIGYPDAWPDDSALVVKKDDAYGNVERARMLDTQRRFASIGQPLNRGQWEMPTQIVNAMNLPIRNALSFAAGILAPPFFDPQATPAANYGGIGVGIGHEISHSFDDQGAKFDAEGHLVDWWTPEDYAHFEAAGAALAAQFSTYKPFPDASVDGKLTLGENLADLAGLSAAYDGWRASLKGAPAPTQDGLTGDQQFFLAFGQSWQVKVREKAQRIALRTDPHAPAHYRALTVRNLDAWYDAFDVKQGEPLFLAPPDRVRAW